MPDSGTYQTWNPAMKRWVKTKNGRFSETSKEKFPDVPVHGNSAKSGSDNPGKKKKRLPPGHPDNPWWLF